MVILKENSGVFPPKSYFANFEGLKFHKTHYFKKKQNKKTIPAWTAVARIVSLIMAVHHAAVRGMARWDIRNKSLFQLLAVVKMLMRVCGNME